MSTCPPTIPNIIDRSSFNGPTEYKISRRYPGKKSMAFILMETEIEKKMSEAMILVCARWYKKITVNIELKQSLKQHLI